MPPSIAFPCTPTTIETNQSLSDCSSETNPSTTFIHVDSQELLQGQKSVTIVHNGTAYRLQATKLGKLILTK